MGRLVRSASFGCSRRRWEEEEKELIFEVLMDFPGVSLKRKAAHAAPQLGRTKAAVYYQMHAMARDIEADAAAAGGKMELIGVG